MKCFPSVTAIGAQVDLVVVAVPAPAVEEVLLECARAGVRGVVVITAGFAEISADGRKVEARLSEIVRGAGMRMVGPNCMGVLNTGDVAQRHLRPELAARRWRLDALAERRARARDARSCRRRSTWGSATSSRSGTRPTSPRTTALVLGGRPEDARHRALPRELRQPPQVRAHRARRRAQEAHRRGEIRAVRRRDARRCEPLGCSREPRRRSGRSLRAGRRRPDEHPRGALRRRLAPVDAALARRAPRRRRHRTRAAPGSSSQTRARLTGSRCRR